MRYCLITLFVLCFGWTVYAQSYDSFVRERPYKGRVMVCNLDTYQYINGRAVFTVREKVVMDENDKVVQKQEWHLSPADTLVCTGHINYSYDDEDREIEQRGFYLDSENGDVYSFVMKTTEYSPNTITITEFDSDGEMIDKTILYFEDNLLVKEVSESFLGKIRTATYKNGKLQTTEEGDQRVVYSYDKEGREDRTTEYLNGKERLRHEYNYTDGQIYDVLYYEDSPWSAYIYDCDSHDLLARYSWSWEAEKWEVEHRNEYEYDIHGNCISNYTFEKGGGNKPISAKISTYIYYE